MSIAYPVKVKMLSEAWLAELTTYSHERDEPVIMRVDQDFKVTPVNALAVEALADPIYLETITDCVKSHLKRDEEFFSIVV